LVLCICYPCVKVNADEESTAGRGILEKWEKAVVTVKVVIKQKTVMQGRELGKEDMKIEVPGTVIDSSGLVVVSLSSIDPFSMWTQMYGQAMENFKWESEVTDVKIRQGDGKEIPGKIAMRDKDLDLAFISPSEKVSSPFIAIDLTKSAKPQVLDHVVILSRLSSAGNWAPSAAIERIQSIVAKPRTFYIPSESAMAGGMGVPVFSLGGEFVGLLVLRIPTSSSSPMQTMFGGMRGAGILPAILPSSDIIEVARQVPESGGAEKGEKDK
jgi:hypothetical protein